MMNQIRNEERLSKEVILGYVRQMMDDPNVQKYQQKLDRYYKTDKEEYKFKIYDELYENYLSEKYSDLNDRYPGIVKMFANDVLDGVSFDIAKLKQFLNMLTMMRSRQEEGDEIIEVQTGADIAKELRNKYVLPKLGLTQDDVEDVDPTKYKDIDWDKTNIKFNTN